MVEPRHLVSIVKRFLNADLVKQHGIVCTFHVTGERGGTFYLDLKNG